MTAPPGMKPHAGEVNAAAAADAIERGDWEAALARLADAFNENPFRPEWTALLDRVLEAGGDHAYPVLRQAGANWVGYRGLLAYAEHRRGEFALAFNQLERLIRDCRWNLFPEAWGLAWVTPDAARAAGAEAIEFLFTVTERYPNNPADTPEWYREQLGRATVALGVVEDVVGADDRTTALKGQMLGKAGRFAEAIGLTERAAGANPTFRTATAAAMANNRAGEIETAVRWFRRAAELDPNTATSFLDIGDIYLSQERWQDAIDAYKDALARKPGHPWAYVSAVYCFYRQTGDPGAREELRSMATAHVHQCSEIEALKLMVGGYAPEDRRNRARDLMREVERAAFLARVAEYEGAAAGADYARVLDDLIAWSESQGGLLTYAPQRATNAKAKIEYRFQGQRFWEACPQKRPTTKFTYAYDFDRAPLLVEFAKLSGDGRPASPAVPTVAFRDLVSDAARHRLKQLLGVALARLTSQHPTQG